MLVFVDGGNWKTWQKTLGVLADEKQQQTQPIVSTLGFQPRSHWCAASALTNAPVQLPSRPSPLRLMCIASNIHLLAN